MFKYCPQRPVLMHLSSLTFLSFTYK
jgi:hypothetical protein